MAQAWTETSGAATGAGNLNTENCKGTTSRRLRLVFDVYGCQILRPIGIADCQIPGACAQMSLPK